MSTQFVWSSRLGSHHWSALRFLTAGLLALLPAQAQDLQRFRDYINQGKKTTTYESVLFLGMFNSPREAEEYMKRGVINPHTGKPYDKVFAFGRSGSTLLVYSLEASRVVADNLSWSPTTNYNAIYPFEARYVVAHSNGNDVLANAIKMGLVRVTDTVYALAPPKGFTGEAEHLDVPRVVIYRRDGDPVAESLGKTSLPLMPLLQKFGDVDVRTTPPETDSAAGSRLELRVTRRFDQRKPKIEEVTWTNDSAAFPVKDRAYFTGEQYRDFVRRFPRAGTLLEPHRRPVLDALSVDDVYIDIDNLTADDRTKLGTAHKALKGYEKGPHSFRTYANGIVYERIVDVLKAIDSGVHAGIKQDRLRELWSELLELSARAPEAHQQAMPFVRRSAALLDEAGVEQLARHFEIPSMWTSYGPAKPAGKVQAEIRMMDDMAQNAQRVVIAGEGWAAQSMYQRMAGKLGTGNVEWVHSYGNRIELWRTAARFGADVILGIDGVSGKADTPAKRGASSGSKSLPAVIRPSGGPGGHGPGGKNSGGPERGGVTAQIGIEESDFEKPPGRKP